MKKLINYISQIENKGIDKILQQAEEDWHESEKIVYIIRVVQLLTTIKKIFSTKELSEEINGLTIKKESNYDDTVFYKITIHGNLSEEKQEEINSKCCILGGFFDDFTNKKYGMECDHLFHIHSNLIEELKEFFLPKDLLTKLITAELNEELEEKEVNKQKIKKV